MNTALGIKFTEIGPDYVRATMPVNESTMQPLGMLNGGASLALIEIMGSMAANLVFDRSLYVALGQAVTCSHIKSAMKGETVTGTARPLHIGRSSQVWEVYICNAEEKLICKGNITMATLLIESINGK